MTFNERDAIKLRMQQIFQERQCLQDEYNTLFSRLREIDERDLRQSSIKGIAAPLESMDKEKSWKELSKKEPKKSSLEWEDFDLGDQDQEQETIDTEEYDKRLNELQDFIDKNE
jgi:hypothetical protein